MTIDTQSTPDLPPCGRRWCHTTPNGTTFKCKPPKVLPDVPFFERMTLLKPRSVTADDCRRCQAQEPVPPKPEPELIAAADLQQGPDPAKQNQPPQTPEVRPDGTLVYQMTGTKPPPIPPGFKRASDDPSSKDAWVFTPAVERCTYLNWQPERSADCNCIVMMPMCSRDKEPVPVIRDHCTGCPHAPKGTIDMTIPPKMAKLGELGATLPPFVAGRDRPVHFEPDGTIVYEKAEGEWEPPRDIEGYEREADNWRFKPLWPECIYRAGAAVRLAGCGCIGVLMRCGHPGCPSFTNYVKCATCTECPFRKES